MAYISFDEYQNHGGTLTEDEFSKREPRAEVYLDHWTLNRMKSADVIAGLKEFGEWDGVLTALAWLTDQMEGIESARAARASGQEVTSFNNGVNSFSFGGGSSASTVTAAESGAYAEVCRMLPVDLMSTCAAYNDAR